MLTVNLALATALQHGERIECQRLHLVFAREGIDRCEETNTTTQFADDIFRMGHAACEQNGVNLSTEYSGFCSDVLGNVVEHGVDDELGVFVAVLDALLNLAHVVCTQMGVETSLAGNALQQLFLRVFATETETDKVGSRQRTCTFW